MESNCCKSECQMDLDAWSSTILLDMHPKEFSILLQNPILALLKQTVLVAFIFSILYDFLTTFWKSISFDVALKVIILVWNIWIEKKWAYCLAYPSQGIQTAFERLQGYPARYTRIATLFWTNHYLLEVGNHLQLFC